MEHLAYPKLMDNSSDPIYMFAYGSNMDLLGLAVWMTEWSYDPDTLEPIGPARLPNHVLVWNDCEGFANVEESEGDEVHGLLLLVNRSGRNALDDKEGHPTQYRRTKKPVFLAGGPEVSAWVYQATPHRCVPGVPPTEEYLGAMISAAWAWNLPAWYVEGLENVPTR